jgi:hypothetical protein
MYAWTQLDFSIANLTYNKKRPDTAWRKDISKNRTFPAELCSASALTNLIKNSERDSWNCLGKAIWQCKLTTEPQSINCRTFKYTVYEGVSKSFRTGRLHWELQVVQLSATRCSCITILWVSLVSFVAVTLCVASQRVFIVLSLYFVIDSVRKHLDTALYIPSSFYKCLSWSSRSKVKGKLVPLLN